MNTILFDSLILWLWGENRVHYHIFVTLKMMQSFSDEVYYNQKLPMNSFQKECTELKQKYDDCYSVWFTEKFLKGDTNEEMCAPLFKVYQQCLKVLFRFTFFASVNLACTFAVKITRPLRVETLKTNTKLALITGSPINSWRGIIMILCVRDFYGCIRIAFRY